MLNQEFFFLAICIITPFLFTKLHLMTVTIIDLDVYRLIFILFPLGHATREYLFSIFPKYVFMFPPIAYMQCEPLAS